jgi:hypothetical protein
LEIGVALMKKAIDRAARETNRQATWEDIFGSEEKMLYWLDDSNFEKVTATTDQIRRYFETRLKGQRFNGAGDEKSTRCPFHEDKSPSLSVNFAKGTWNCHAGCGGGGISDFEERISRCNHETAKQNVSQVMGEPVFQSNAAKRVVAKYSYTDREGRIVAIKLRYEPKSFGWCRPDGKGSLIHDTKGHQCPSIPFP